MIDVRSACSKNAAIVKGPTGGIYADGNGFFENSVIESRASTDIDEPVNFKISTVDLALLGSTTIWILT
jgi:hypothetical protein